METKGQSAATVVNYKSTTEVPEPERSLEFRDGGLSIENELEYASGTNYFSVHGDKEDVNSRQQIGNNSVPKNFKDDQFDFTLNNEEQILAEHELDIVMHEQQPQKQPKTSFHDQNKKRKLEEVHLDEGESDEDEDDSDDVEYELQWEDRFRDSDYEQDDDSDLVAFAMAGEYQWNEIESQLGKNNTNAAESDDDKDSDDNWDVGDDISEDELLSHSSSESEEDNQGRAKVKRRLTNRFVMPNMAHDVVFEVGHEFINRKEFQFACRHHGVMAHRRIRTHVCNPRRCTIRCRSTKKCPWMISANFRRGRNSWVITSMQHVHTCTPSFNHGCCNYKYLSFRYKSDIQIMPEIKISELQQKAQNDLNVAVTRDKCKRAKEHAMKEILGDYRKQYTTIRDYCNELRRSNPNSSVLLQITEDSGGNQFFRRLYICFDACKRGFVEGCRCIVGIDAYHLKGPHHGVLLAAIGMDANDQIFPVAYAVVENECKSSWKWFLGNLQEDINIQNSLGWTIISDKHPGIDAAMKDLFPRVEHRKCTWHLYNNFKVHYSSLELKEMFWAAAKCTNKNQFEGHMEKIKMKNPTAYQWLQKRTVYAEWSRAHFNFGSKCDILVNNIVETPSKEVIYRPDAGELGPKVRRKLEKNIHESRRCIARASGENEYQITCGFGELYAVKLNEQTCGCKKWDLTGIPCAHAIAAIGLVKEEPEAFVSHWYSKEYYKKAYKHVIHPINGPELWDKSAPHILLPNVEIRIIGRPPKARKKSAHESKKPAKEKVSKTKVKKLPRVGMMRQYSCSSCNGTGHTKKKCPKRNQSAQPSQAGPSRAPANTCHQNKETKVRGCSQCRQPGHYKTSCTSLLGSCAQKKQ